MLRLNILLCVWLFIGLNFGMKSSNQSDVNTVNYEKLTNEEVETLASMTKDELYDTIQELHQERMKVKLPQLSTLNPEQFLLQSKNNILFLIVNKFLTCKDVLILQKTCKFFKNLLQPQHLSNMIGFCNYADSESQHMTETTIIWDDLKHLQNCYSAFDQMEMFNIKINVYAVLTSEKKIIAWNNCVTPYPQILLHEVTKKYTICT